MSKLEQLISTLCPNGVEYKALIDICITLKKSTLKTGDLLEKGQYPVINSGRDFYGYYDNYNNDCEAFTVASRGEYAGYIKYIDKPFWAGGLCYPYTSKDTDIVLTKFIYYYLKFQEKRIMDTLVARGSIPAINKIDVDKVHIPVPPMEVQNEIVRILDNFTELTAELTARKQQYEYYRDELLNFDDANANVLKVKIKDYFTRLRGTPITAGKMKEIANDTGEIRIFAGGRTVINAVESEIPKANITRVPSVIVQSRGIIDFIYYDKPFTFKNEMWWAYTHENITTLKFLYYILKNNAQKFREASSGMGAMPQISLTVTEDFEIPLPPLEEQERIVSILDRFDKLCNDISEGLPAEIEARQKQYEYYRDKLLSFKNINA